MTRAFIISSIVFAVLGGAFFLHAPIHAQNLSPEERAQLQVEYDQLQKEIVQQQQIIAETEAKKNTYQGNVATLNAQIKAAQAQIDSKNIQIKQLSSQIAQKNQVIGQLSSRIDAGHESLASLLRQQDQLDSYSAVEVALSADNVSSFFADLDAFVSIETNMQSLFSDIKIAKSETETQKAVLADTQSKVTDARYDIQTKQQQVSSTKTQQQQLLNITANQEAQYQKVLAANQAKADAIRAKLYPLRDTGAINEGDAIRYAQEASAKTGVRPAVILAVLSQESDLGRNVGNCYVTDLTTGNGVGKNTGTPFTGVMKAPRDTVPFKTITDALGKDWSTTPVSCPQSAGYGGAMGPTQFIPSTWMLYVPRIKAALGVSATNPWNAEHAIMATALYLSDAGAARGGYTAERNAACVYFSGHACPATGWVASYGSQVMAKADGPGGFQQDINTLANNS